MRKTCYFLVTFFPCLYEKKSILAGCRKFLRCGPGCNVYLFHINVNTDSINGEMYEL